MTKYLVNRTGKLLFPHLARDQRKHQMFIILLVLATSFSAACSLVMWMTSGRNTTNSFRIVFKYLQNAKS